VLDMGWNPWSVAFVLFERMEVETKSCQTPFMPSNIGNHAVNTLSFHKRFCFREYYESCQK